MSVKLGIFLVALPVLVYSFALAYEDHYLTPPVPAKRPLPATIRAAPRELSIKAATYGGNCGAPLGNATNDVVLSCNGKTACAYTVEMGILGDPAPRCGKDFSVSYSCLPDSTGLHKELPAEAGLGGVLNLGCASAHPGSEKLAATPQPDLAPPRREVATHATRPLSGLNIRSATYGGNCGAAPGNATRDLASHCNGRTECAYSVKVEHLGDPAPRCGKDFVALYSCAPDATILRQELPGEAGFGAVLNLDCTSAGAEPARIAAEPSSGLYIRSATYGGNCGAAPGNATRDLASNCNGKTDCAYSVKVERLGDPAPKCGKDFAASYSCAPDATVLHQELPGEAGFGSALDLTCPAADSARIAPEPSSGLNIHAATYGGNCGAAPGNATRHLAASCNGRTDCTYSVEVEQLGDPAPKCGKDFVATYSCAPDATILQTNLPAEAGFGSALNLTCAPTPPDSTKQ